MIEREVNDAVGRGGTGAQAPEIVETAAVDLGARGLDFRGCRRRTRETDDAMTGIAQLSDDGRPDEPRRPCDEYAHVEHLGRP